MPRKKGREALFSWLHILRAIGVSLHHFCDGLAHVVDVLAV
jgi:hypothetical protein